MTGVLSEQCKFLFETHDDADSNFSFCLAHPLRVTGSTFRVFVCFAELDLVNKDERYFRDLSNQQKNRQNSNDRHACHFLPLIYQIKYLMVEVAFDVICHFPNFSLMRQLMIHLVLVHDWRISYPPHPLSWESIPWPSPSSCLTCLTACMDPRPFSYE